MNALAMRMAGMGGLGDPLPDIFGDYDPLAWPNDNSGGTPIRSGSPIPNNQPPWWAVLGPSIITTAGKDIQSVFGNQYQQQTYPRTTYSALPAGYTYNAAGQIVPLGSNAGGATIDSIARWASSNWLILVVAGGILFFPGFQRRR